MPYRYVILAVLLGVGVFYNQGVIPLDGEEHRRAFVAIEMMYRNNWIVPTMIGDIYRAKPPLFEWVLMGAYQLFGSMEEWVVRIPSNAALLVLAGLTGWWYRRHVGTRMAYWAALMVPTSVGIFYNYSFRGGEIDFFFSMLMFGAMGGLFYFGERKQWGLFYLVPFTLTALAFLAKGFPAPIHLYLTLAVYVWMKGDWKRLFSVWHFVGIAVLLGITGGYFYIYSQQAPVMDYLRVLWGESSSRTVVSHNPFGPFFDNFLKFPIRIIVEVLPWSLMGLWFFKKSVRDMVWNHPALKYSVLVLAINLPIYWISPGTLARVRYFYPFLPFAMVLMASLLEKPESLPECDVWLKRATFIMSLTGVIVGVGLAGFGIVHYQVIGGVGLVVALTAAIVSLGAGWYYYRTRVSSIFLMMLILVTLRFSMDSVYLPYRATHGADVRVKRLAARILELDHGRPLRYWGGTIEKRYPNLSLFYYLEKQTGKVVYRETTLRPGVLYFSHELDVPKLPIRILETMTLKYRTIVVFEALSEKESANN